MSEGLDVFDGVQTLTTGSAGRTFTLLGKEMPRFSFTHRLAYFRLTADPVSDYEAAIILAHVCQRSAKEADLLRGEKAMSEARLAACKWFEELPGKLRENREAVLKFYNEVWDDIAQAESVEPAGGSTAGNA